MVSVRLCFTGAETWYFITKVLFNCVIKFKAWLSQTDDSFVSLDTDTVNTYLITVDVI